MQLVIHVADPAGEPIPQAVLDALRQRYCVIDDPLSWADVIRRLQDGTLRPAPVMVLTNVDMTAADWPRPGAAMPDLADHYRLILLASGGGPAASSGPPWAVANGIRYSILVVDDEPDTDELFRQGFRPETRCGECRLHFAHSGTEALDQLKRGVIAPEPLLILTDINMPDMDGFQLLDESKRCRPELHVVMVTAYGDDDRKQRAGAGGASGYFEKPIDFEELKRFIRTIFKDDGPPAPAE